MTRRLSKRGQGEIHASEGLRLFAYPDPDSPLAQATPNLRKRWGFAPALQILASLAPSFAQLSGDPWSIAYGHTKDVKPSDAITEDRADAFFMEDSADAERCVNTHAPNVGQNQFDALVSLVINIGCGLFGTSTMLRLIRAGDFRACTGTLEKNWTDGQFYRFRYDNGRVIPALITRRAREAQLFAEPDAPVTPATVYFGNVESGVASTAPLVSGDLSNLDSVRQGN